MAIDISKIAPKTTKNKGGKELRFIKKHAVSIATDANKDQNDISKKMKMSNRNPLHGYNPGQDERVYESTRYWSSPKQTHIVHGDLSNSQGMKRERVPLRVRAAGKPHAMKVAKEHWEEHGWKVDNVKHHRIIEEGYYKERDIERQEKEAKKQSTKSLMMDKIAKSQHHMSKDGKNIALKHLKGMKNDDYIGESIQDLFENWEDEELNEGLISNIKRLAKGKKVFGRTSELKAKMKAQYQGHYSKANDFEDKSYESSQNSIKSVRMANKLVKKDPHQAKELLKKSDDEFDAGLEYHKLGQKHIAMGLNSRKRASKFPGNSTRFFKGKK